MKIMVSISNRRAIVCNRCYMMPLCQLFLRTIIYVVGVILSAEGINPFAEAIFLSAVGINLNAEGIILNAKRINLNAEAISLFAEQTILFAFRIFLFAVQINLKEGGSFLF